MNKRIWFRFAMWVLLCVEVIGGSRLDYAFGKRFFPSDPDYQYEPSVGIDVLMIVFMFGLFIATFLPSRTAPNEKPELTEKKPNRIAASRRDTTVRADFDHEFLALIFALITSIVAFFVFSVDHSIALDPLLVWATGLVSVFLLFLIIVAYRRKHSSENAEISIDLERYIQSGELRGQLHLGKRVDAREVGIQLRYLPSLHPRLYFWRKVTLLGEGRDLSLLERLLVLVPNYYPTLRFPLILDAQGESVASFSVTLPEYVRKVLRPDNPLLHPETMLVVSAGSLMRGVHADFSIIAPPIKAYGRENRFFRWTFPASRYPID